MAIDKTQQEVMEIAAAKETAEIYLQNTALEKRIVSLGDSITNYLTQMSADTYTAMYKKVNDTYNRMHKTLPVKYDSKAYLNIQNNIFNGLARVNKEVSGSFADQAHEKTHPRKA